MRRHLEERDNCRAALSSSSSPTLLAAVAAILQPPGPCDSCHPGPLDSCHIPSPQGARPGGMQTDTLWGGKCVCVYTFVHTHIITLHNHSSSLCGQKHVKVPGSHTGLSSSTSSLGIEETTQETLSCLEGKLFSLHIFLMCSKQWVPG